MADDAAPPVEPTLSLITAAIAFLDTEAAFGSQHERTLKAKAGLRTALEGVIAPEHAHDLPDLRVIPGGAHQGG